MFWVVVFLFPRNHYMWWVRLSWNWMSICLLLGRSELILCVLFACLQHLLCPINMPQHMSSCTFIIPSLFLTPTVKTVFLVVCYNLFCFCLCPQPPILAIGITERNVIPFFSLLQRKHKKNTFWVFLDNEISPKLPLLQVEKSQLSQPLLMGKLLKFTELHRITE